ncbi:MAG TPA: hypothetical protein PLV62_10570 [Spirochaetota bacterium]|nr:hypothetical protein [Spirochaetota bacterium]HOT20854.1 hypothetical protein [Spirochaetota bacterium]HPK45412.1 hypothetical protein [Spirochaetota bacterium]HQG43566.1 hypothetical protein [Spirochaetota bacterium]HRR61886.1 hypothetical protein [Spirochaetota bacterium]
MKHYNAWNEKTQYLHSMRGKKEIEENGKKKKVDDETIEEAQQKAKEWIEKNVNEAVESAIKEDYKDALYKFGQALHTEQDSVSHGWCTIKEHGKSLKAFGMDANPSQTKQTMAQQKTKDLTNQFLNAIRTTMMNRGYTNEQITKTIEGLKQYKPAK